MVRYHCKRCHIIWYNNEHPIIRVPFYNPYRLRCPHCYREVKGSPE